MARLIKSRRAKAGLPPGTIVDLDTGTAVSGEIVRYDSRDFTRQPWEVGSCVQLPGSAVTWLNVEGIHDAAALQSLGSCFGIHPLVLEDIQNPDQRPKKEDYGDYLYIVAKMLTLRPEGIAAEQLSILLGEHWVVTVQEGVDGDLFDPVRTRLQAASGKIRSMGPDYLAYTLLDAVVDQYFVVIEQVADDLESLENRLMLRPGKETLAELQRLKRELLFLRKSVWPLREVIGGLERRESPLFADATLLYLRDLYDHTIQIIDTIETFRDMLSGLLDIYLSGVANRTNEVMRVLTVIATIFMPITFIAGVYGMNFKNIPEYQWEWSYPLFWIVTLLLAGGMALWFRRKKWL